MSDKWKSASHNGAPILFRDIPYEGKVGIMKRGDRIFGVSGDSNMDELYRRLDDMFD